MHVIWSAIVCACTAGYENEVLVSQVSQMQTYKDRIDEMDSVTLHAAQLEQMNARCCAVYIPSLQSSACTIE